MNISQLLVPVPALQQVLDSAVAEIHQDLDRRAQDILHLAQRARFAARLKELMGKWWGIHGGYSQKFEGIPHFHSFSLWTLVEMIGWNRDYEYLEVS